MPCWKTVSPRACCRNFKSSTERQDSQLVLNIWYRYYKTFMKYFVFSTKSNLEVHKKYSNLVNLYSTVNFPANPKIL